MSRSDTVDPYMLDYTDAQTVVAKARDELAAGHDKKAAELLTDAAYQTRDPEIERQVRELAARGLSARVDSVRAAGTRSSELSRACKRLRIRDRRPRSKA